MNLLTHEHLGWFCRLNDCTEKTDKISARKLKMFLTLKELGLLYEDEEGFIKLTPHGENVLAITCEAFTKIARHEST